MTPPPVRSCGYAMRRMDEPAFGCSSLSHHWMVAEHKRDRDGVPGAPAYNANRQARKVVCCFSAPDELAARMASVGSSVGSGAGELVGPAIHAGGCPARCSLSVVLTNSRAER